MPYIFIYLHQMPCIHVYLIYMHIYVLYMYIYRTYMYIYAIYMYIYPIYMYIYPIYMYIYHIHNMKIYPIYMYVYLLVILYTIMGQSQTKFSFHILVIKKDDSRAFHFALR